MTTRLAQLTNEQVGNGMDRLAGSDTAYLIIEYLSREIESRRDDLERATPDQVPSLQGRIHELRRLIVFLTPKPLRGAVPPMTGA
jgi:hypothetical protein